ncbi:g7229 [Coccomyxa elongata]
MATRTSFRPRPLDLQKQLPIVRDLKDLDSTDGLVSREITHNHEALDKENEEAKMVSSAKAKGGKEIPVPKVTAVPTYNIDYLPTFREQSTYIRGRGGIGYHDERFIEYDLDKEDEEWLEAFNRGQEDRLPARRMELLMWRLECANAEATDRALAAAGAAQTERQSPAAAAAVDHMTREEAYEVITAAHPVRTLVRDALYAFWRTKRERLGKPLIRRLQAPTSASDQNPFGVFRPREKIHRPQTRRRRENNEDSLEKMQAIRKNMKKACEILEWLTRREQRKVNLAYIETDLQRLQMKLKVEPRHLHEAIEAEYAAAAKAKPVRRPIDLDPSSKSGDASNAASDAAAAAASSALAATADVAKRLKKRKKDAKRPPQSLAALPPQPLPPSPTMLFTLPPNMARMSLGFDAALPDMLARGQARPRIGRGGRLIFDRVSALTLEEFNTAGHSDEGDFKQLYDMPNPYSPNAQSKPDGPRKSAGDAKQKQGAAQLANGVPASLVSQGCPTKDASGSQAPIQMGASTDRMPNGASASLQPAADAHVTVTAQCQHLSAQESMGSHNGASNQAARAGSTYGSQRAPAPQLQRVSADHLAHPFEMSQSLGHAQDDSVQLGQALPMVAPVGF